MAKSAQLLLGFNLYTDKLDHLYYKSSFTHKYYAIDKKSIKKYTIYSFRFPISLAVFYFAYVFSHSLWIGAGIGVVIYVAMAVAFHTTFLKSLVPYDTIKGPLKLTYARHCKQALSKIRLLALILLSALLTIALILNALISDYGMEMTVLNYILAGLIAVFCIIHILFYFKGNYIHD